MGRRVAPLLAATAVAVIATAVGYVVGSELADRAADGPTVAWSPLDSDGRPAWLEIPTPDVAFRTAAGDTARLADYRGGIVLLNFWGSWCPPCLVEIPHLVEVQDVLEELGGTIIGPAVGSGSGADVLRFAEERGINYPVWLSDYDTAIGRFGAAGYPFTLLIDREGIIRKRYLGPQTARTLLRDIGALVVREPKTGSPSGAP
jgi:peroxiredoxin